MQRYQKDDTLVVSLQQGLIHSLQNAGITDTRVLKAFRRVPRHAFVIEWYERGPASKTQRGRWHRYSTDAMDGGSWLTKIYQDQPLVTRIDASDSPCSSSSQPSIMAEMLEALDIQPGNRVAEIGTGRLLD